MLHCDKKTPAPKRPPAHDEDAHITRPIQVRARSACTAAMCMCMCACACTAGVSPYEKAEVELRPCPERHSWRLEAERRPHLRGAVSDSCMHAAPPGGRQEAACRPPEAAHARRRRRARPLTLAHARRRRRPRPLTLAHARRRRRPRPLPLAHACRWPLGGLGGLGWPLKGAPPSGAASRGALGRQGSRAA